MTGKNWKSTIGNLAPVLLFLLVILMFYPYPETFQADSDEGVNLMKASMMHKGYGLYTDIWSDQPPLLTFAIRVLMDLFGARVWLIRTFILLISALMFFAFYQLLTLRWGPAYAAAGAVILFFHPSYVTLSTSIMVGLPSIAFVFISLFCLHFWHRNRSYPALVLSAAAMAVSIGIKLFTGFVGVIIIIGLLISEFYRSGSRSAFPWRQILAPAFVWGVAFTLGSLLVVVFLVGFENLPQLIRSHLGGVAIKQYQKEVFTINYHLKALVPTFFLALIGLYLSVREKNWFFLYFAAWSLSAYLLLLNHSPVWYHHKILVSAPAAMLAAVAAGYFVEQFRQAFTGRRMVGTMSLVFIGLLVLFFDFRVPHFIQEFRLPTAGITLTLSTQEEILLSRIASVSSETNWFLTDQPMYAIYLDLAVPPDLAAFTNKRYQSGELTEPEIIAIIRAYKPEQILLGRGEYPQVHAILTGDYHLIEQFGENVKYYIRSDIAVPPP